MTTARAGRRRRLLHEGTNEVSSASTNQAKDSTSASGVRYAPGGDSLSFNLARRVFPQSPLSVALATFGILGLVGLAVLAAYLGVQSVENPTGPFTQLFAFSGPGTFGAWVASTLWLGVAFVSYVIYGLRRHRMDDLKSRYRWWVLATVAAIFMSFTTAVGFHHLFANKLAIVTGWSALSDNAIWWLLPSMLLCGSLVIRMAIEQSESKASLALTLLAILVTAAGWTADAGLVPQSFQANYDWLAYPWLGSALATSGVAFLLLGTLMFARNIVREADGLFVRVERTSSSKAKRAEKAEQKAKATAKSRNHQTESKTTQSVKPTKQEVTTIEISQPIEQSSEQYYPSKAERRAEAKRKRKEAAAQQEAESGSSWVSGSESDYQDEYDDSDRPRKLTKAQRKRLRKQKARRAA